MAIFNYTHSATYIHSGGFWAQLGPSTGSGTLSDNDFSNDTFGDNEIIVDDQSPGVLDHYYIGTVTLSGVQYIIVGPGPDIQQNAQYTIYGTSPVPNSISFNTTDITDASGLTGLELCFAAGTHIATPDGETTVETLEIGDLVTTADGRVVPVKWIGRQTLHKLFAPAERFSPVRVSAGALGDGLPHSDLVLTVDHALILDGLAICAGALVNGTTITFDPVETLADSVTYYHVETENHEVILANGTPAETFVDGASRQKFDNHAEYVAMYGEERLIKEMPLPRVTSVRLVPSSIRARLDCDYVQLSVA